tara:strand:+ start:47 stop:367 length:321 start_codon:yes stop_codon:yes gene_type:complete
MGILSSIGKGAAKISKEVKVRRRELAREKYKKTFNKLTDRQKKKVQDQAEIEVWGPDPGEQEAKMMDRAKAADFPKPKGAKGMLIGPAYRHGYKDLRKIGTAKRMK